jgi:hypothetical protein
MATNHYFTNYDAQYNEQRLVEDLIVESIKIMGTDTYYLPNTNSVARDLIYGEDPLKTFTAAFPIEIYPTNVMEFGGQREFFGKFGLEIKNEMTVVLSRRTFNQRVANPNISRPQEGDLIYVPILNGTGELYEIKFVNQNKDMDTLGRKMPYFWELELEKFKYSQETIATGIPDIDIIQQVEAYAQRFVLTSVTGSFSSSEIVYQSSDSTLANASVTAVVVSYDAPNSLLEINQITGDMTLGQIIYGNTSNAHATLYSTDEYIEAESHADYDNKVLTVEANTYIDFSETNPFGSL